MSIRSKDVTLNSNLWKTMTPQQVEDMYNDFADEYEEMSGFGFEQVDAPDPAQQMSESVYQEMIDEIETGEGPNRLPGVRSLAL